MIGTLNPRAWDAVKPYTPFVFSNAHVELLVTDAARSVAGAIGNKGMAKVAGLAVGTMTDEFERCGTVPRKPFPGK